MKYLGYILVFILFTACKRDEIGPQFPGGELTGTQRNVIMVGEGNFNWGNAEISVYYPDDGSVVHNVFFNANGYAPGDVAQSIYRINHRYFLVMNNSQKIEVLDTAGFESIGQITGLVSPRYAAGYGNLLYITDLYSNFVSVADINSLQIIQQIPVGGASEHILVYQSKVYVAQPGKNRILVIDAPVMQVTDTIPVRQGLGRMVTDHQQRLWASCSGTSTVMPALYCIHTTADTVLHRVEWNTTNQLGNLSTTLNGDSLIYSTPDIYVMSVNDILPSSNPLFTHSLNVLYSLQTDPLTGDIYLTDALDYISLSDVYRYSRSGILKQIFKGPVNCGFISFSE